MRYARARRPLLLLLAIALVGCNRASVTTPATSGATDGSAAAPLDAASTVTFPGLDAVLHVRVADTEAEREYGLMGVTSMPKDDGMAFVFDTPTTVMFWMKDTLIPLSIAFVATDGTIVTISEMTPCTADPCTTYPADAPYVLAIEANAGWFAANGVAVGDHAVLTRS